MPGQGKKKGKAEDS